MPRRPAFRPALTHLEDRYTPANTSFAAGVLTIDFTAASEAVTLTNSAGGVTLTGTTFTGAGGGAFSGVTRLVVTDGSNSAGQSLTVAGTALTLPGGLSSTGVETNTFNATVDTSAADLSVTANRNIAVAAALSGRNITLDADTGTQVVGNFVGVDITASVTANGTLTVEGRGGDTFGFNIGVRVRGGAKVQGGAGAGVTTRVTGTGGASSSDYNSGVYIANPGSSITSGGGGVAVDGTGGPGAERGYNTGVSIEANGQITAGGSGAVTVTGRGVSAAGGSNNHGVFLFASQITSAGGGVTVNGTGGGGTSGVGVRVDGNGGAVSSVGNAPVTVTADSLVISGTSSVNAGTGTVTIRPRTAGRAIDLGSATDTAAALELSDAELDRVTAGTLIVGRQDLPTGAVTVSAPLTLTPADVRILSGRNIAVTAAVSGANVTLDADTGSQVAGNFVGVDIGANVTATGTLTVDGRGGDTGGFKFGVRVELGAVVQGGAGTGVTTRVTGRGGMGSGGLNPGVFVIGSGSQITSGGGAVTVDGTGGGTGAGNGDNHGVHLKNGGRIAAGGSGAVNVTGRGGMAGVGGNNHGVYVFGFGAQVTSGGGAVTVDGTGGGTGAGSASNIGVIAQVGGQITAGGSGAVSVTGRGSSTAASSDNYGVYVGDTGSRIASGGGAVTVEGTGGAGANGVAVVVIGNGVVASGGNASVIVTADSVTIDATGSVNAGTGTVTIRTHTAGTQIDLGTETAGRLSLTDAELDRVTAGTLILGRQDIATGAVTVSAPLTLTPADVRILSGRNIVVNAAVSGANVTLDADTGSQVAGNFVGVDIAANVTATGTLTVEGRGGDTGSDINYGVRVTGGAKVQGGTGPGVTTLVTGNGGAGVGIRNYGVQVNGIGSEITSGGGGVSVQGTGGGVGTSSSNYGVHVLNSGRIGAGGAGAVSVTGRGGVGTGNDNIGVIVAGDNATISSGGGAVDVEGTGGGTGGGNFNHGVYVELGGQVTAGGSGAVGVIGRGGTTTGGSVNHGLFVVDANSKVTSGGGAVSVDGRGGGTGGGSSSNIGVIAQGGGQITAGGSGALAVTGGGSTTAGGIDNHGVFVIGNGSRLASGGGAVTVNGNAGNGAGGVGVVVLNVGAIASTANAPVTITADSVNIESTTAISSGTGTTTFRPRTAGTRIDLGGADVLSGSPLTLGLTDVELDRVTAGTLVIGSATAGNITVTAAVTPATAPTLSLVTGGGVSQSAGAGIAATNLAVRAVGAVVLDQANAVGTLAASVTGAGAAFTYTGTGNTTVGTVDGVSGLTTSGGNISVTLGASALTVANAISSGVGNLTLTTARNIVVDSGVSVTSTSGSITLSANRQATPTAGNFTGIIVRGTISGGSGDVTLAGTGGTDSGGDQHGVYLMTGMVETTDGGAVTITGTGGASDGGFNVGLYLFASTVSTTDADVVVIGTGGGTGGSAANYGVFFNLGGQAVAGGSGTATVIGTGGGGSGGGNYGVYFNGNPAGVSTLGGAVSVAGTGGGGSDSFDIYGGIGRIRSDGNAAITVTADSLLVGGFFTISSGTGTVTIRPRTAGTRIDLGGEDVLSGSPLTLGLTDAELDQITAGTLVIGDANAGDITVSADHSRPTATDLQLVSGGDIDVSGGIDTAGGTLRFAPGVGGSVSFPNAGTDATATATTFATGSRLAVDVGGTTPDSEFGPLVVNGPVDLTGVTLALGGAYVPAAGDSLAVVSGTSVAGTFAGLPDGSVVTFNGVDLHVVYSPTAVTLVANRAPVGVSAGGPYSIREGDGLTVSASTATDPDGDPLTYTWDVNGDGTFGDEAFGTTTDGGRTVTFTPSELHALGLADGPLTITPAVRVSDGLSGGTTTATGRLTVTNVTPTVAASGSGTAAEGAAYTLTLGAVTDPGQDAVTQYRVNWGDGTFGVYTGGGDVTHVYADDGVYAVTVDLMDEDGTVLNAGTPHVVTVGNVAPTITSVGVPARGVGGTPVTVSATAADPAGANDPLTHSWAVTREGVPVASGQGATFTFTPTVGGTFVVTLTVTDGDGGTVTTTRTVEVTPPPQVVTAVGGGVRITSPITNTTTQVTPFPGFLGGVSVAAADLNGDGVLDLVVGAGPGGGPHVRAFDGATGMELASFFAFDPGFTGGVSVAAANGRVVLAAGPGGGPHVKVLDASRMRDTLPNGQIADLALAASFYAYDPAFTGGVSVAAADLNGDGVADVVTGAGACGAPHVKAIDGLALWQVQANGQIADSALLANFFAFNPDVTSGVNVAASNGQIAVGPGAGNGPHVKVFDAAGNAVESFFAYDPAFTGGVRVGFADANGDGLTDLLTAAGPGGGPHVKAFVLSPLLEIQSVFAADAMDPRGVFVN